MEKNETAATIELLAPVGGHEQLLAAVRCGADAVYLGAKGFNARRNAENFEEDTLETSIAYCHGRGVKVYVTLNTLIMDDELQALKAELDTVAAAGADAIIVQDLLTAKLIRERYPTMPMSASTQMVVHNAEGVRMAKELGFSQAVLARELSLAEIRSIRAQTDLSLEVFVHGAQCMCVSGACYLSSMIGTRSGNRGLCAQPCRTNFQLDGREYALSLKDMSLVEHLAELREAGVDSLKIEGRMKRPEYVAAAVTACRMALQGQQPDLDTLRAVFSRSGFTDEYLTGTRTIHMFGYRTKEDVTAAPRVLDTLKNAYAAERANIIVDMDFVADGRQPAALTVTDGIHTVRVVGPVPEAARSVPLTQESVRRNLEQTGGTPFKPGTLHAQIGENLSLPVSAQKALRREALEQLLQQRSLPPLRPCSGKTVSLPQRRTNEGQPCMRLRFETIQQMFEAPETDRMILPVEEILTAPAMVEALGERLIGELPAVCFPESMPLLRRQLEQLKRMGLTDVLAGNCGMLELARELGFVPHADYGMNILNSVALAECERLGCADATISFELAMSKIRALGGNLPRGIVTYGYLPLMKVRACPAKGTDGCGACSGRRTLTDARQVKFTLLCHKRQYGELLNGVPLDIADKPIRGVDFITLRFTTETAEQARAVYQRYQEKIPSDQPRTGGLYYRELL